VKWFAFCLFLLFGPLIFLLPLLGLFLQPWAPWWFGKQSGNTAVTVPINTTTSTTDGLILPIDPGIPLEPPAQHAGIVSDAERYQFIRTAGAPVDVAIVMTALSIAEDGSGDPRIVSKPNVGLAAGTVDIGILQINSAHIGQCGIQSKEWLFDPLNNARAAMCILGPRLNYCAWSTYEVACGPGHTGAYAAFLPCARAIAEGNTCRR